MSNTPAYLIGNYTVIDEAGLGQYLGKVGAIVEKHHGKVMVFSNNVIALEGEAQPVLVIVEFPSMSDAKAFYDSPEYAPVRPLRINATQGGFLTAVEGMLS